ncbi:hypothetical protein B7463_g3991, partial [Scytalidium lignicola]
MPSMPSPPGATTVVILPIDYQDDASPVTWLQGLSVSRLYSAHRDCWPPNFHVQRNFKLRPAQPEEDMKSENNHESLDFSQDDGHPLMASENWDDEESIQLQKRPVRTKRSRKVCSAILSIRYVLDTVLLILILVFLVTTRSHNRPDQLETSGDITGFAPIVRRQIKSFAHDSSFTPDDPADWFTNRVKQNWLNLVPKGLGYVRIDKPEEYDNLPEPLPEYDSTVFTTSVTHQLHCLYKLQEVFSSFMLNRTETQEFKETVWHSGHCFEYLRQSILCCGDTALEGKQTSFPDKNLPGSDGWDAKHICRNYDQIRNHLERNRMWKLNSLPVAVTGRLPRKGRLWATLTLVLTLCNVWQFFNVRLKSEAVVGLGTFEKGFDNELHAGRAIIKTIEVKFSGDPEFAEDGTPRLPITPPGALRFVGTPGPEVDEAWEGLGLGARFFLLSEEEAKENLGEAYKRFWDPKYNGYFVE